MRSLLFLFVTLLLVFTLLSGCVDTVVIPPVIPPVVVTPPAVPINLHSVGYMLKCRLVNDGAEHLVLGKLVNTGDAGQFKLNIYYCLSGLGQTYQYGWTVNDTIDNEYPLDLTLKLYTMHVWKFRFDLYELHDNKWVLKESREVDTPY